MTDRPKQRAIIIMSEGNLEIYSDPGVDVMVGVERGNNLFRFKQRPIPEELLSNRPVTFLEGLRVDPLMPLEEEKFAPGRGV